jgi:glycosyltransferase A (GT-A) superfamily protein (DUF2064 family)
MIFYAPPTPDAEAMMKQIMIHYGIPISCFTLLPMIMSNDMNSSNLSSILETSLCTARQRQQELYPFHHYHKQNEGYVIFIGMDAPEIPLHELIAIVNQRRRRRQEEETNDAMTKKKMAALILPADDGGYGLLAVPSTADPTKTFRGIRWSDRLTSLSQMKALNDQDIPVIVGQLMFDIDEPDDVTKLCHRIQKSNHDVIPVIDTLSTPSILAYHQCQKTSTNETYSLRYTKEALRRLGLLNKGIVCCD